MCEKRLMKGSFNSHIMTLPNTLGCQIKETQPTSKIYLQRYCLRDTFWKVNYTGVKYRNPVKTRDLTSLAFIMITNILLQGGHFGDKLF